MSVFAPLRVLADWDKALLIGVGSYPYLNDADLNGPPNDVANVEEYLTQTAGVRGSDIRILVDELATKEAILSSIKEWLNTSTAAGDRILVYFSGHGSHVADQDGDEEDGRDETIVPHDYGRGGTKRSGMITDDELKAAFSYLKGRDVVLISDSCHSGTLSRSFDPSESADVRSRFYRSEPEDDGNVNTVRNELTPSLADDDVTEYSPFSLSAAAANQLSWEQDGEGIFTKLLLEGLKDNTADRNRNGSVTVAEILEYVRPKTEEWCETVPRCRMLGFTPSSDPLLPRFALNGADLNEISPVSVVTDIIPENDDLNFQLSIEPSATARVGENSRFRIESDRDGFLLLFDLSSKGELTLLFPKTDFANPYQKGKLKAGVPILVPDPNWGITFEVTEPGEGNLLSIVVDQNIDPEALLKGLQSFKPEPLDSAEDTLQRIAEQLLAPAAIGMKAIEIDGRGIEYVVVAPPKWSASLTEYKHVH